MKARRSSKEDFSGTITRSDGGHSKALPAFPCSRKVSVNRDTDARARARHHHKRAHARTWPAVAHTVSSHSMHRNARRHAVAFHLFISRITLCPFCTNSSCKLLGTFSAHAVTTLPDRACCAGCRILRVQGRNAFTRAVACTRRITLNTSIGLSSPGVGTLSCPLLSGTRLKTPVRLSNMDSGVLTHTLIRSNQACSGRRASFMWVHPSKPGAEGRAYLAAPTKWLGCTLATKS